MKKRLLVLGMAIICIFGMTACGKAADESAANTLGITEEGAINLSLIHIYAVRGYERNE